VVRVANFVLCLARIRPAPIVLRTAVLLCSFALQAQAPNPFLGTWKLNSPAGVISVRQYQDQGGGLMLHTIVTINPNGAGFTFTAARYDGKDYAVYVPRTLGEFVTNGTKPARTVAFTRKDANTLEWTDRVDGRITSTGVNQVSEDGKTMTESVKVFDRQGKQTSTAVTVYDKQQ
jgi:hypothetical protein